MNLQQKPSTASEPLNSSTYERHLLHGSPYLTSQWCMAPSTWLTHQLEEDVGCKVPHFINNEDQEVAWSQNPMVYKHSNFFTRKMRRFKSSIKPLSPTSSQERWSRANSVSGHNLLKQNFAQHLCNLCHL